MQTTISTPQMSCPRCQSHVNHYQIDCNETGFQLSNVDAKCNTSQSTKTNHASGFIGEKGIEPPSLSLRSPNRPGPSTTPSGMVAPMWTDPPHHIFGTASLVDSMASTSNDNAGTQSLLQPEYENEVYVEKKESAQTTTDYNSDSVLLLPLRSLRSIRVSINDLSSKAQGNS
jgi:hypothetical protein